MFLIRNLEVLSGLENLRDIIIICEGDPLLSDFRFVEVILLEDPKLLQMRLHGVRCHEGEKCVDTVLRVVVRERAKEELAHSASETESIGITLAVGKTPGSEVIWSEIVSEEAVSTSKGNGVTQDGATDSVS